MRMARPGNPSPSAFAYPVILEPHRWDTEGAVSKACVSADSETTSSSVRTPTGAAEREPDARIPQHASGGHFVQAIRREERRKEQHVVAARQALQHERGASAGERAPPAGVEVAPDAVKGERHPLAGQHLQVRD